MTQPRRARAQRTQSEDAPAAGRVVAPQTQTDDSALDRTLRPRLLDEYVGQAQVVDNLRISIQAAKQRGEPLEHTLLYGPPGLGKTTLATIIAQEMGARLRVTSGPAIEKPGELASILTILEPNDVFFIDEVHRLSRIVEEVLYPAMEEQRVDVVLPGKGPGGARMLRIPLKPFTLVGATTRYAQVSAPLRDRFGNTYRLDFYSADDLLRIVTRSARVLGVEAQQDGLAEVAKRARGTPRVANRLLRRVRDYAQVKRNGAITKSVAQEALAALRVDPLGLDEVDVRLLRALVEKYDGGPAGLDTLAAAIGEDADTVMDVYEPFLLQLGFIARTPRGRAATRLAYEHLGMPPPANRALPDQGSLFGQ